MKNLMNVEFKFLGLGIALSFFVFSLSLSQLTPAKADEVTDAALVSSAQLLKEAGHRVFYGFYKQQEWVPGYQALVLNQYCPEIYRGFTGQTPVGITSGRGNLLPLRRKLEALASKCSNPVLVSNLMIEYWFDTGLKVENFLTRVTKLVNHEDVTFCDPEDLRQRGTRSLERVIREHGTSPQIAAAVKFDTFMVIARIWGDLNATVRSVKTRIAVHRKYTEIMSSENPEAMLVELMASLGLTEDSSGAGGSSSAPDTSKDSD